MSDELNKLRQERDEHLAALESHVKGLKLQWYKAPGEWAAAHPLVTAAGAAVAGFLAGRMMVRRKRPPRVEHLHRRFRGEFHHNGHGHAAEDDGAVGVQSVLQMLAACAEPLMALWQSRGSAKAAGDGSAANGEEGTENQDARVCVGDAGTSTGQAFPGNFKG